jgi:putative PEP-CTERM system histidine kinase
MPIPAALSYAAVYFSLILSASVLLRDRHSFVHRVYAAGMFLFAVEEFVRAYSYGMVLPADVIYWHKRVVAVSVLIPAVWLAFSVSYARVNFESLLSRWRWALVAVGLSPILFLAMFRKTIYLGSIYLEAGDSWSILLGWPGRTLQMFFLSVSILILFNLEQTIRSSVGRMRWQIKFMALGVGLLFGVRIYLAGQALLFSTVDTGSVTTNAVALIAANLLFALSLYRGSCLSVDVYLSTAAIQNSLIVVLVGIYLLSVGLLAHAARYVFGNGSLPVDTFLVSIALTALAALLLSNRLQRKLRLFVNRHFRRPVYDYRSVWMKVTERTRSLVNVHELSTAVSRMLSESLDILSVSVWLVDESQGRLTLAGSTAISGTDAKELDKAGTRAPELIRFLRDHTSCVDLNEYKFSWPEQIMQAKPELFRVHRMRYAVGLNVGGELVGVMTLNDDRVGHQPLTTEDFVLVETLASQLAAGLLNIRLSERLRRSKEVETFQTVSTFFVHDLKNLASRLSLTMQNLPAHFDNPEFRADALRVISNSLTKIDEMCERLAMLKQGILLNPTECDLKRLITSALDDFKPNLKAELKRDLRPIPKTRLDSEEINKVFTNLIINANEAVNGNGVIQVTTLLEGDSLGFSVRDNGCGMSQEFVERLLFRPFQTTKKKGLGIGLFHSKLIVEAHRGRIEVNSSIGAGTEFRVLLPIT